MVASKFLHDDGEVDEVFNDEWAASAGLNVKDINSFERDFLQAIVSTILVRILYLNTQYEIDWVYYWGYFLVIVNAVQCTGRCCSTLFLFVLFCFNTT